MLSLHRLTIFSHLCNYRHSKIRQIGTYLRLVPNQEAFEFRFNATQLRWAGHNRWSKIGRKKMAADCVRATFVSKFVTKIKRSIRENGASLEQNTELRQLIVKGRELQIPKSTLDRSLTTKQGKIVTQNVALRGESGFTFLVSLSGDLNGINQSKAQIKKVARKYQLTILPGGTGASFFVEKELTPQNGSERPSNRNATRDPLVLDHQTARWLRQ